jgi:hypothetical protein
MTRRIGPSFLFILTFLVEPAPVSAGMPTFTVADLKRSFTQSLADPTRMRLEAISFFLLGLLLCTGIVQGVWNWLRKDFTRLPRLSYAKAFGIILLWGLLFVIVLTMISGARELMTPGAWEKTGFTYRVPDDSAAAEQQITARYEAIERLAVALFKYAAAHHGTFPTGRAAREIPDHLWKLPGPSGERYIYLEGRVANEDSPDPATPVAYETESVGADRLVLMNDGRVGWMSTSEIERTSNEGEPTIVEK